MDPQRKHPLAKCEDCPLVDAKYVPSSCPDGAKVAVVSRSPGRNDTTAPFTGPSQKVLDYLLEKNGYSRENVVLTNVVLCQTDAPSKQAIEACRDRLYSEIGSCDTIIAAGTEAVSEFTSYRSVSTARGFVHESRNGTGRVIAANNPALVLRESDTFPTLVTDFKLALNPLPSPIFPEVEIINEPTLARDRLQEWGSSLSGIVATDLEWSTFDIYCAGFATDGEHATVFGRNVITDPECMGFLKRLYESEAIRATWHTGKSDTSVLWRNGIRARVDEDVFFLSYVLDEEPGRHSLDYLLQTHFGWPYYEPESVTYFKENGKLYGDTDEQRTISEYELYEYNGWDAAGTYQLYDKLSALAASDDVLWPYENVLLPASNAFRSVELHGFKYDAEGSANIMEAEVLPLLKQQTEQMREISKIGLLNPRSTKQMSHLYYDKWGLRHNLRDKPKKKFSRSTGKEVREEIEGGRFSCTEGFRGTVEPFADVHRRYAKVERQRSNYFQSLIERIDGRGYIHPWFNLGGTRTGRSSSTEPNFQNITREGVEGITSVRSLFLPSEGNVLIQADYSQAELRTMAWLSQDPKLLEIYYDNTRSLHKERAAAFYGENYTKEEYVKSKNINFGVSYWQSAAAFAQMYHMDKREAQQYIDSWWEEFPVLHQWTKDMAKQALTGEVVSPLKYKRRFHLITNDNINDVQREGINFVPQNTAGGLTLMSVSELVLDTDIDIFWYLPLHNGDELEMRGVPIVNSVHDSIVADVPKERAVEVAKLMKQVMEAKPKSVLGWDLPFTVDISIGDTWATVEEVDL